MIVRGARGQAEEEPVVARRAQHQRPAAVRDAGGVEHQVHAQRGAQAVAPPATKLSVNGPVALDDRGARTSKRAPVSASTSAAPRARPRRSRSSASTRRWLATAAPAASASSTFSSTRRASSVWQST